MDLILRSSIWIALALFVAAEYGRSRRPVLPWAWRAWTAGALVCAFHVGWAMGWRHGWSHVSALGETAAQTASVYGVAWSGGVYVNYVFLAAWLGEAWWWRRDAAWTLTRSRHVTWGLRAFYFLIIVNAAVVFTTGRARMAGVLLVVVLAVVWIRSPTGSPTTGGPGSLIATDRS